MPNSTLDIAGSEKPFEYFIYVASSEEDVFSSKAAEEFDVNQSRAATVLSELEEFGALKSKKKGRKRVYTHNMNGLIQSWYNVWSELANVENIELKIEEIADKEEFEDLLENYFRYYLDFCTDMMLESSFREMFVEKFLHDLDMTSRNPDSWGVEVKDWFDPLQSYLSEIFGGSIMSQNFVADALEDPEEFGD